MLILSLLLSSARAKRWTKTRMLICNAEDEAVSTENFGFEVFLYVVTINVYLSGLISGRHQIDFFLFSLPYHHCFYKFRCFSRCLQLFIAPQINYGQP